METTKQEPIEDEDITLEAHDEIMLWLNANIAEVLAPFIPPQYQAFVHFDLIWEKPILSNGRVVGFIDMAVFAGTLDREWSQEFYIEVKSAIPSLGSLMRQIHRYEASSLSSYLSKIRFMVVSPDDRFADVLRQQEIEFVEYKP